MATFRQVKTSYWLDSFILDLSCEARSFYLYLITNPKSTQCGIFELSVKLIVMETGYSTELVQKLILEFCSYGKILYDEGTHEFLLVNWMKHNRSDNIKILACIEKELLCVRSKALLEYWNKFANLGDTSWIPYRTPIDTPSHPGGYPMDRVSAENKTQDRVSEKSEGRNKERIEKKEIEVDLDLDLVLDVDIEKKIEEKEEKEILKKESLSADISSSEAYQEIEPSDSPPPDSTAPPHVTIIRYLNQKTDSTYQEDGAATIQLIQAKMSQGFCVSDFFTVIDKKSSDWKGTPYEPNLTPFTLFTDRFEGYLLQKTRPKDKSQSGQLDADVFTNQGFMEVKN